MGNMNKKYDRTNEGNTYFSWSSLQYAAPSPNRLEHHESENWAYALTNCNLSLSFYRLHE